MECVGIAFCLAVVGLFLLIVKVNRWQQQAERWNRSFALVNRRFGGDWTRGGWFRNPSLRMVYGQTFGRVTVYRLDGKNSPWCAEMAVQLPDLHLRAEIFARLPHVRLARGSQGLERLEVDGRDFGAQWQIMTDSPEELHPLLSRAARMQLDQLTQHPFRSEAAISLLPNWLIVRKMWSSLNAADLEQFVQATFDLHDQLQVARSAGIEFVEASAPVIVEGAHCCICGEGLARDVVLCRRCKTPHHHECWEYTGQCSTYGCRETQFELPDAPANILSQRTDASARPAKPR